MAVKHEPTASNCRIGNKLKDLGVTKDQHVAYKKLKSNEYLAGEIATIRENHAQRLSREIVPDALKETKRAINDKKLAPGVKLGYVKLALDKEFGEQGNRPQPAPSINIGQVQAVINNHFKDDD